MTFFATVSFQTIIGVAARRRALSLSAADQRSADHDFHRRGCLGAGVSGNRGALSFNGRRRALGDARFHPGKRLGNPIEAPASAAGSPLHPTSSTRGPHTRFTEVVMPEMRFGDLRDGLVANLRASADRLSMSPPYPSRSAAGAAARGLRTSSATTAKPRAGFHPHGPLSTAAAEARMAVWKAISLRSCE